ncbi:MAG TPA: flagellar protein FlaG [Treponemataceae bacterium]|nr:flagellar protein FlaG [Treponemataceae bacterium]HOS35660.1 flagellar protein FlaG [Treponemataceae bacterium]HPL92170.1 flagellar protein FlaG [Treponemataceae bacterium]HQB88831.1 flagellar protein FlaG [Treponemataceae bacterium]HRR02455.1 flagellar protein FlaG [Treponemataceae bacterium]
MSIEISSIGQHVATMDRRLEGTGNTSTRSASSAVQPSRQDNPVVSTQLSEADVARIAEQIQKISDMFDRKLQFQVSKELEQVIVKVIDSSTDKIIREIPSAEIQKLQLRIKETLGLLFDESI